MNLKLPPGAGTPTAMASGFTLMELLVVLTLIGLMAGLILPASLRTSLEAKKQQARVQEQQIASALTAYHSEYGRFPLSLTAQQSTDEMNEDITYGAVFIETRTWLAGPCYSNDNSELIPALLDLQHFGDGSPTLNEGHAQNPNRVRFLEAAQPGGTNDVPGVGIDGVYRDPWRAPYFVTLDLNGDGRVRDILYRNSAVSQDPQNPGRGLQGFIKTASGTSSAVFEAPGPVLVWSAGPDRRVGTRVGALQGVNKDNILSCSR